jgi:hypothetical protein
MPTRAEIFKRTFNLLILESGLNVPQLATVAQCSQAWIRKAMSRGVTKRTEQNAHYLARLAVQFKIESNEFWSEHTIVLHRPKLHPNSLQKRLERELGK